MTDYAMIVAGVAIIVSPLTGQGAEHHSHG